jgi:hypothetical protein
MLHIYTHHVFGGSIIRNPIPIAHKLYHSLPYIFSERPFSDIGHFDISSFSAPGLEHEVP